MGLVAAGVIAALAAQRAAGQTVQDGLHTEADSIARTAGLPVDVRSRASGAHDLEIRAYLGFGSAALSHLVRITRSAGRVKGELLLWWPGTTVRFDVPDDPERPIAQHDQEIWVAAMRARARAMGCGPVTEGGWVETCVLERSTSIDWQATLDALQSAGIAGGRTQRSAPAAGTAILYVQVRTGSRFTTYSFAKPQPPERDTDARAEAHLVDLLIRLFS